MASNPDRDLRLIDKRRMDEFLALLYRSAGRSTVGNFKSTLSIDQVDNTRDLKKPVSEDTHLAITNAVDQLTDDIDGLRIGLYTRFSWTAPSPSQTWLIPHNLGRKPHVSITDPNGEVIYGDITHLDNNTVSIYFSVPMMGSVEIG